MSYSTILQPMDVAVFHTLKQNWKQHVHKWRSNHLDDSTLKKKDFAKLLKEVVDKHVTLCVSQCFPQVWTLSLGLQDIKMTLLCRILCRMTTYIHV